MEGYNLNNANAKNLSSQTFHNFQLNQSNPISHQNSKSQLKLNSVINTMTNNPLQGMPQSNNFDLVNNTYLKPLQKQIEQLKNKILYNDDNHNKEVLALKEKFESILKKRDLEVKAFTDNMVNQIRSLENKNLNLQQENKILRERTKIEDKTQENKEIETRIKNIKLKAEQKIAELDSNFDHVLKSLNFNINPQSPEHDEQMYILENKIKLLLEEIYLKDKQLVNQDAKLTSIKEENFYLKEKFTYEKSVLLEELEKLSKYDFQDQDQEIFVIQTKFQNQIDTLTKGFKETIYNEKSEKEFLQREQSRLILINSQFELEIENLNKENQHLKIKIEHLEREIGSLSIDIVPIKDENKLLIKENQLLKSMIDENKEKLDYFLEKTKTEKEIKEELELQYRNIFQTMSMQISIYDLELKKNKEKSKDSDKKNEDQKFESLKNSSIVQDLEEKVAKLKLYNSTLENEIRTTNATMLEERKKSTEIDGKNKLLIDELKELKNISKDFTSMEIKYKNLLEENDSLKKELAIQESRFESSRIDSMKEMNKLKNALFDKNNKTEKVEKQVDNNYLELKNELKLVKLCISRTYKSYFNAMRQLKEDENITFKGLDKDSIHNQSYPKLQELTIPQYEEAKMLEDITSGYDILKDTLYKMFTLKKEKYEISVEWKEMKKLMEQANANCKKYEEENILLKIKASNIEQRTKANLNLIFKQLKVLYNNQSTSGFDKSPLFAFLESVIIYIRKQKIHFLLKEHSKKTETNLENIMKQAESGYNELINRSKLFVLKEEVVKLTEKVKEFNAESIDFIIKTFLSYKINSPDNEVLFKMPITDFNSLLDKIAHKSDTFTESIDKLTEINDSTVSNSLEILIEETKIEENLVKEVALLLNSFI